MSVTFLTTSLASQTAPVVFTTTSPLVPVVSVKIGNSALSEERVYRDGAFLYPYQGSTRVLNTFTILRAGGWPRAGATPSITVYVYEDTGDGPSVDYVVTSAGERVVTGSGEGVVP